LHRVGFKWSRPQRKWYAPGDQDTEDFARKITGGSQCLMCGNFVSGDGQGHKPTCGQAKPAPVSVPVASAPELKWPWRMTPEEFAQTSRVYEVSPGKFRVVTAEGADRPADGNTPEKALANVYHDVVDMYASMDQSNLKEMEKNAELLVANRLKIAPAPQPAAATLPKSPTQDSGVGDNVVSRCGQCGQWKGPSHVCAKSEAESAVCRMEDKEWRAYQKTLKTPDGKPDHKALARALHLRESGAEAALLSALADAGTGRLQTTELSDLPIPEAVANGALRRLREKGMVGEKDGEIALLSVADSVEPALRSPAPSRGDFPASLNTSAKRDLFEALGNNEQLALAIDAAIRRVKRDDWRSTVPRQREVQHAIFECLDDDDEAEALVNRIFELAKSQTEY